MLNLKLIILALSVVAFAASYLIIQTVKFAGFLLGLRKAVV